jgi:ADP-heptose:LPS heptosyltransferase
MTETPALVKRVLLVALDNLGDLVFASALAPPLRTAFPEARIDVWCKALTAPVGRLIPDTNEVIAADPFWAVPPGRERPPIGRFLRSIREIRRRRYEIAVLSEAAWRAAASVWLARIPVRVGLARHRNGPFLTLVLPAEDPHRPVLEEQARLLTPFGVHLDHPRYRLDPARLGDIREVVARRLSERSASRFVALHPFAAVRDRCVPLSEWTQLAFALHARGLPVLWIGTTAELGELRAYTHPRGVYVDELVDGSLGVTAAALSLASAFVGHDSGPLHVAGALGVPVVGVFAPGQPDRTFPQGAGPWRMIHRPSPSGISAAAMFHEIESLVPSLASAP